MHVLDQIAAYISGQPEPKRSEIASLHSVVLNIAPGCRLWFLDGKDASGKVVTNPNVGYGVRTIKYANGTTKEFYRVGLSANTSGISVYIMGIEDKYFLSETYAADLGKATVTGYCIKFRTLKDVNLEVLQTAMRFGLERQDE